MKTNPASLILDALVRLGRHPVVIAVQAVTLLGCALLGVLQLAGIHTGAPTEEMLAARRAKADHAQAVTDVCYRRIEQGDLADALPVCREAVSLAPYSARARKNLGLVLLRTRKPAEGVAVLGRAVEISPAMDEAHFLLGKVYQDKGDSDLAIYHYRLALAANPYHFRAHYGLARACEMSGQHAEAIREYETLTRVKPDYSPTYTYLIPLLHRYGRLNQAKELQKRQHI